MPRDYPEYEDESPEETYRDPLKPFLIALVVLLLPVSYTHLTLPTNSRV